MASAALPSPLTWRWISRKSTILASLAYIARACARGVGFVLDVLRQKKRRIANIAERESVERQDILPGYDNIMSRLAVVSGDSSEPPSLSRHFSEDRLTKSSQVCFLLHSNTTISTNSHSGIEQIVQDFHSRFISSLYQAQFAGLPEDTPHRPKPVPILTAWEFPFPSSLKSWRQ